MYVHTSIAARSFVYPSRRSRVNVPRRLHLVSLPSLFSLSSSRSCVCGHRLALYVPIACYPSHRPFSTSLSHSSMFPSLSLEPTLFVLVALYLVPYRSRLSVLYTYCTFSLFLSFAFSFFLIFSDLCNSICFYRSALYIYRSLSSSFMISVIFLFECGSANPLPFTSVLPSLFR